MPSLLPHSLWLPMALRAKSTPSPVTQVALHGPAPTSLHFSIAPPGHSVASCGLQQHPACSGFRAMYRLFPLQVKLFLSQMLILALNTVPPPSSGLTQVLLSLESPPRALQIWLGHPYYIFGSLFISVARTSIHRPQIEVLHHHTIQFFLGMFFLPYISPAETEAPLLGGGLEQVNGRTMTF